MMDTMQMLRREASPFVVSRLSAVLALAALASALNAMSPVCLQILIDDLTGKRHANSGAALVVVGVYVVAMWLTRAASEYRGFLNAVVTQRICRTLSDRLVAHLMRLPLQFHLERKTGAVSQILDNGLQGLRMVLQQLTFTFVPVSVQLTIVIIVLADVVTPVFIVMFCVVLASYAAAFALSAAKLARGARAASAARVATSAAMTDSLINYETVKYFAAEGFVQERVRSVLDQCEVAWVCFYRKFAANGVVISGIFALFLSGTVLYAVELVRGGRITVGEFVLVNAYILQLVSPVETLGSAVQGMSQGVAMLEKLVMLFREPMEVASRPGGERARGPGCLEFRDVTVSYGSGRHVLRGISFRIAAGRTLAIVGHSGAGKSTIVRLLMRLVEPARGSILLDGVPIVMVDALQLRSAIAVVPQDTGLFDDTLRCNIALGRPGASAEAIEEASRMAQLHEFVMTLSDGYDTLVGERGVKLSTGERQRVSIARAILKSPKIYVFDEATSSLDARTELEILRNLRAISNGNTTVVIAHRLSAVVHADEIVLLEDGCVAECGNHHSLLKQDGRYAALWRAQMGGLVAA